MNFRQAYKMGWGGKDSYISKLRRMKANEISREIRDLKYHMATLDVKKSEQIIVAKRALSAYKLSAIIEYLRSIL